MVALLQSMHSFAIILRHHHYAQERLLVHTTQQLLQSTTTTNYYYSEFRLIDVHRVASFIMCVFAISSLSPSSLAHSPFSIGITSSCDWI